MRLFIISCLILLLLLSGDASASELYIPPGQSLRGCIDNFNDAFSYVIPQTLIAYGGAPAIGYGWTVSSGSSLPPQTTVDSINGVFHRLDKFSNPPPGNYTFKMDVTDGTSTATGTFFIEVTSSLDGGCTEKPVLMQNVNIDVVNLPDAKVGEAYGAGLFAMGGKAPYRWSIATGKLPPGIIINQGTGVLSGTPLSEASGQTFEFTVKIVDRADNILIPKLGNTHRIKVSGVGSAQVTSAQIGSGTNESNATMKVTPTHTGNGSITNNVSPKPTQQVTPTRTENTSVEDDVSKGPSLLDMIGGLFTKIITYVAITFSSAVESVSGGSKEGKSELNIDSLSTNSAMPMALLTITGSGFDNGTNLYVRFSDSATYTVDVPAIDVISNSLKAGVPPYINTTNGKFAPGKVNVQVIKKSGKDIRASNIITDFLIADLPYPALPAGTTTIGFLKGAIDRARELQTEIKGTELDTPEMNAALSDFIFKADPFLVKLQDVVRDPSARVSLGSINGTEIKVGSEDLLNVDRMILGMLHAQADGGNSAKGASSGFFVSLIGIASAQEDGGGCQVKEAVSMVNVLENGKENADTVGSWAGYYGAPTKSISCKTAEAFNKGYLVIGGVTGVTLGLFALAGAPAYALALPTAAVLYITIEGGAGIAAVGGALGKNAPGAIEMVKTGVELIEDQLRSSLINAIWEKGGIAYDLYKSTQALKEAFLPEKSPAVSQSATPITTSLGPTYVPTPRPSPTITPIPTSPIPTSVPTPQPSPTITQQLQGELTGTWKGTFQIQSMSSINGIDFCGGETTGAILIFLTQSGSDVTGSTIFSDITGSITYNQAPLDCLSPIGPSRGDITATVSPNGGLKFTYFLGYPAFTANIAGNTMTADFGGTFSNGDDVIILKKGSTTENVIGPTESTDTGSFNVQKVSNYDSWIPAVPPPVPVS